LTNHCRRGLNPVPLTLSSFRKGGMNGIETLQHLPR
jgi:hypothetical protein